MTKPTMDELLNELPKKLIRVYKDKEIIGVLVDSYEFGVYNIVVESELLMLIYNKYSIDNKRYRKILMKDIESVELLNFGNSELCLDIKINSDDGLITFIAYSTSSILDIIFNDEKFEVDLEILSDAYDISYDGDHKISIN